MHFSAHLAIFPCITASADINLIMASSTDRGTDSRAADSLDTDSGESHVRSIEAEAPVAVSTPVRGTRPRGTRPVRGTVPRGTRPSVEQMSAAMIGHFKEADANWVDLLDRKAVFTNTDEDRVLFEKIKEKCGHHMWIPTVPACQKAMSVVDKYFGNRVTGNTSKVPDMELYRADATRLADMHQGQKRSRRNADYYAAYRDLTTSSEESPSTEVVPLAPAGAPQVSTTAASPAAVVSTLLGGAPHAPVTAPQSNVLGGAPHSLVAAPQPSGVPTGKNRKHYFSDADLLYCIQMRSMQLQQMRAYQPVHRLRHT